MKRYLAILLLVAAVFAYPVYAWFSPGVVALQTAEAPQESCSTSTDSAIFDQTAAGGTNTQRANPDAMQFTLAAATTITQYQVNLCQYATTGGVNVSIYTDSGSNTLGSIVADTTVYKAANTITECSTITQYDFDLGTPKSLSSGTYWLVIAETGTSPFVMSGLNTGANDGIRKINANGSVITTYTWPWAVWGCTE